MPILNHTNRSTIATTKSSGVLDTLSTYLVFSDCSNQLLKHRRTHGLQFPLHFQQVIGWAASVVFVIVLFGTILPKFSTSVQWVSYAIFIPLLVIYTISHFLVVFLDPVEKSLRNQPRRKINSLNRVRNSHVIENGYCNLCLIEITSQRTKHCRACNKCVVRFDHHCKWLNQCIGQRNYVPFLMCVISASIISILLMVLIMAEVVLYFCKPNWLQSLSAHQHNLVYNSTFMDLFFNTDNNDIVFLIIIAVVGILATVSAALLIHLCFFHFYITCRGLTTYEYIRAQRGQSMAKLHTPTVTKISVPIRRTLTLQNLRLTKSALVLCTKQESNTSNTITESVATTSSLLNHSTIDPLSFGTKNLKIPSDEPMSIVSKKLRGTKRWSCCVSVPDSPDDPISFTISRQPFQDKNRWNAIKKFFHFRFGRRNNNQIVPFKASDSFDGLSHLSAYNIPSELPMLPPPARKKLTIKPNQIQRANTEPIFSQMLLNDYFPHSVTYTNNVYKNQASMNRRRRINYIPNTRQKTPTLSPIKESGYSNPSSPSKKSIISVSTVSCDFTSVPSVN